MKRGCSTGLVVRRSPPPLDNHRKRGLVRFDPHHIPMGQCEHYQNWHPAEDLRRRGGGGAGPLHDDSAGIATRQDPLAITLQKVPGSPTHSADTAGPYDEPF